MADVVFFEKPGCAGNARQRRALEAAGHTVQARSLPDEPWTPARLRPFFGDRPVADWFNRSAPAVKNGEVDPDRLDADTALALLIEHPLLIRRPLLQVGSRRECGWDAALIHEWIGLGETAPAAGEGCARPDMPPCRTRETNKQ